MPEIVLYQFGPDEAVESGSPFCVKVHRALNLKGLAYRPKNVGSPAQMKRINPGVGKVPVLGWDDELVPDSSRIFRLLEERQPSPPLDPPDPKALAHNRLIEDWADEGLYWFAVYMRWQIDGNFDAFNRRFFQPAMPIPVRWFVPGIVRKGVLKMLRGQGLGRQTLPQVLDALDDRLDLLEGLLGDSAYLLGDAPLAADLAVFGPLRACAIPPMPQSRERVLARPKIVDWLKRVDEATAGEHTVAFEA